MSKKLKDNNQNTTISKQTIDFLVRQFNNLKDIADKSHQNNSQTIKQTIYQAVTLMEKRICFSLDGKSNPQFQDYLTEFYQQQISSSRVQLNNAKNMIARLQNKNLQLKNSMANQQSLTAFRPHNQFDLIEQKHLTASLKNQLSHCQALLNDNQTFIQDQNCAIKQLTAHVKKVQQRENSIRRAFDQKIINFDDMLNQNSQKFKKTMKQFTQNRKSYDRQIRQLQVTNAKLIQDKHQLEKEINLKAEQIRLLSRKVYDLGLVLSKYQRQASLKQHDRYTSQQAMIMLDKEVKIWKQKVQEVSKQWQNKMYEKINELKIQQFKLSKQNIQITDYKERLNEKNIIQKSLQAQQKILVQKNNKLSIQLQNIQDKYSDIQQKLKKLNKQSKEFIKIKENLQEEVKKNTQIIQQLQANIKTLQNQSQIDRQKYQKQKSKMKNDIMVEVEELLHINQETVQRIRIQQKQLQKHLQQKNCLQVTNKSLREQLQSTHQAFNHSKNLINRIQNQKNQVFQVKKFLQKELQRVKQILLCKQITQKENNSLKEQLQQKTQQLQDLRQTIQKTKKSTSKILQAHQSQNINSKTSFIEQTKTLRQEIIKKDFIIKQLNSKVSILQEQLRQTDSLAEKERAAMKNKIKQLQDLVRERYDFSNRQSSESLLN